MSTLRASNIQDLGGVNQLIKPGMVVQVQTVRTDSRTTIASNNVGNGTTITQLNLSITPKFANSKLIMQWMINGEVGNDQVFLVHKDGALITTAGATAYNAESGNIRSSGLVSAAYDVDNATTMSNYFIQYECISGSTSAQVFAPAIRASGGSNATFFFNRTVNAVSGDGYENSISNGVIWEIAQ